MKLRLPAILRRKAAPPVAVSDNRAWWPLIRESFTGAWQRNITVDPLTVYNHPAVYACVTLIASDIAKNRVRLVQQDKSNPIIWTEVTDPGQAAAFAPVLRKPNPFQTRVQFWECWMLSKLFRGNTYVLKVRDNRNVVSALYVLDPNRVKPMVASDGSVFYQLRQDNMAGIEEDILVPAREIIHDRMNPLFHWLIGTSPIYAAGRPALLGSDILSTSIKLFENNAQPGGILTAPGDIGNADVERIKDMWERRFSGDNVGRLAVFGSGVDYKPLAMTAIDLQMIDQLKWSDQVICSCFHVPGYKIGVGPQPLNNNVQSLNTEYYAECLQILMEAAEECLDDGLGIGPVNGRPMGVEFDTNNLLRMDSLTQMEVLSKGDGIMEVNEQRAQLGLGPTIGGDAVYKQEQNYSLPAMAKRDALPNPFGAKNPSPPPAPAAPPPAPPAKDMPDVVTNRDLEQLERDVDSWVRHLECA